MYVRKRWKIQQFFRETEYSDNAIILWKSLTFSKKVLERVYKRKNSAIIKARVAQTVARQKKIFKGESHEREYQTTL